MRSFSPMILCVSAALLPACQPGPGAGRGGASTPEEAWDAHSDPGIFGLKSLSYEQLAGPRATRGALDHKPWADTYWPYYNKNIAWRYAGTQTFGSAAEQISNARANRDDPGLSPAEKFDLLAGDDAFGVTSSAWATYTHDHDKYGDDPDHSVWGWMGMCNGWSAGALALPAPAHHVVADAGGNKVVFFEGDLRGLIDKAYDLNAVDGGIKMVGTRCDLASDDVAKDALGRAYDGKVIGTNETFNIIVDNSLTIGALEVTHDPLHPAPYWIVADAPIAKLSGPDPVSVYRYRSRDDVAADILGHTVGQRATQPDPLSVVFYKGCRDVNPASVHLAFAQLLSDAAPARTGFVMDSSRYKQIWNYPIWGFDSRIAPPVPVSSEPPAWRVFRAPGTAFTAKVTTRIVFVTEIQPQIEYPDEAPAQINWSDVLSGSPAYSLVDISYTLEFDDGGMVIGGEWAENPNVSVEALAFIWREAGAPTDLTPAGTPSPLKFSLLKKLLDCSKKAPDTSVQVVLGDQHRDLQAVHCPL